MSTMINTVIRPALVKRLGRHLMIDMENGMPTKNEYESIMRALKGLSSPSSQTLKPRFLSVKETAAMLNVSDKQIYAMEKDGTFPVQRHRVGGSVKYLESDVIDYMLYGSLEKANGTSEDEVGK